MHITLRQYNLLFALISAAILAAVLIAQYGFGLHPCHLCVLQRVPYAAIVAAGAAAFALKNPRWQRMIVWLIAVGFAADSGMAIYHAGVEYGWFPGPEGCSAASSARMTIEDMKAAIMGAPLVTCDQPMAVVLGLSLAGWNALLAAGLTVAALFAARRSKA